MENGGVSQYTSSPLLPPSCLLQSISCNNLFCVPILTCLIRQDKVYIFGGEYATLDQFHHYRDMWALDLKTNIWEEIPISKVVNHAHWLLLNGFIYDGIVLHRLSRRPLPPVQDTEWLCGVIVSCSLVVSTKHCVKWDGTLICTSFHLLSASG